MSESDSIGLVLLPLSTLKYTKILEIDGESVSNLFTLRTSSELEPGKHTVLVSCNIQKGGLSLRNEETFERDF